MPGTASREKGSVFFHAPSHVVFPSYTADQWGDGESKKEGRGVTNGCEQRVEKDTDVKTMNLWVPVYPPPFCISFSSLFSVCHSHGTVPVLPNQQAYPLLSSDPHDYSLGSVIRV